MIRRLRRRHRWWITVLAILLPALLALALASRPEPAAPATLDLATPTRAGTEAGRFSDDGPESTP